MRRRNTAVNTRHDQILQLLGAHDFLTVKDLSALLKISEVTIRRDLEALDSQGMLNRRHGGAFRNNRSTPSGNAGQAGTDTGASSTGNTDPIRLIASRAMGFIEPGNVIILSAGPISEAIARELLSRRDITVITNSVAIFDLLRTNENIHLIATGGELRRPRNTLVGPLAEASIREVRVDKLFLEPSGISHRYQLYHTSIADVPMQQVMIQAAREVIVVADSSVFGREGIMQLGPVRIANRVIVDGHIPNRVREDLTSEGVEIVTAEE